MHYKELKFSKQATTFSPIVCVFSTGQRASIHSVILRIPAACNSWPFEKINVALFTKPKTFKQAWATTFNPVVCLFFTERSKRCTERLANAPNGSVSS